MEHTVHTRPLVNDIVSCEVRKPYFSTTWHQPLGGIRMVSMELLIKASSAYLTPDLGVGLFSCFIRRCTL
jgi:hypothetical protein